MNEGEGYIKFTIEFSEGAPPSATSIAAVDAVRTRLWKIGLVGATADGIGYGNLSVKATEVGTMAKAGPAAFCITGTATGGAEKLGPAGYTLVYGFDRSANAVRCTGPVQASSESLSHGACYEANPAIAAVIHVHNRKLYDFMVVNAFPATSKDAEYGTPQIANEIYALVKDVGESSGIFYMGGHDEGVIAYAEDIESAESVLMEVFQSASAR